MPPVHQIQASFAGGEFAPSLYARVDLQKYATGARTLRNFFVHPHGGASNRPGTRFVALAKYPTKKARAVAFEFSTTQAYIIEFGHLYCRFYMNGGQIIASAPAAWSGAVTYAVGDMVTYSGVKYISIQAGINHQPDVSPTFWTAQIIYEIATPYTETDLPNLKFAQSADTLYICHPSYAPRTLIRTAHDNWILSKYVNTLGPFMLTNVSSITLTPSAVSGAGITLTASANLFNSLHVGSLWRVDHIVPGQSVTAALSSVTSTSAIVCGTTWRIITHGTWTAKFRVESSIDQGASWQEVRTFDGSNDFNPNTSGTLDTFARIRVTVLTYTSGTLNLTLSADPFDYSGIVQITGFTNATTVTATVVKEIALTSATAAWAEGSWSDYRGYPSCCTFYQDRLSFANTVGEPQTAWMTETGNYVSFKRSDPLVDSDGITTTLPSRKVNAIRSMVPLSQILAMTSASEWSIGPADNGGITPTSINQQIQGYRGCSICEPIIIGNRVIYVQPLGSVVRDIGVDFTVSGFSGSNLSIISNHLFTNYSIVEMAFQQEPDSLVWCIRSDGALLSMTYLLEHQVLAWTRHDTNGTYESVASIPGSTYNEVWFVVKRGNQRYFEKMVQRLTSTDPRDQFFVDCGLSYDIPKTITAATQANPVVITSVAHGFNNGDKVDIRNIVGPGNNGVTSNGTVTTPATNGMDSLNGRRFIVANKTADTFQLLDNDGGAAVDGTTLQAYASGGEVRLVATTIGGLSHLEGFSVTVLADGNVQGPFTVTGGQITLNPGAGIAHIGLAYTCDLETLNAEVAMQSGTSQGRKIRVARTILRFLNSRGGYIGPDSASLLQITQRTAEPLGSPISLFTGDYDDTIQPDYLAGGRMFYRQIDPLPVTILGAIPVVVVGES